MPFKTILILINIAIICIIACIIVKLYYRDEEKGRKLETHEIESSLKGHNQMPLFKEEHHKKDSRNKINNTISSTKNKIFKTKQVKENNDNLNKEIEELTITRPKTTTTPSKEENNKIIQTTNTNGTILKEKPKNNNKPNGKPISINVKNSPEIKPKVVNAKTQEEIAKDKLKTTATKPKVSKEEIEKIEEKPVKAAHKEIVEPEKDEIKEKIEPKEETKVKFIKPKQKAHITPKLRTEPKIKPEPTTQKIKEEKPEPTEIKTEPTTQKIKEEKPEPTEIKTTKEEKPEPTEIKTTKEEKPEPTEIKTTKEEKPEPTTQKTHVTPKIKTKPEIKTEPTTQKTHVTPKIKTKPEIKTEPTEIKTIKEEKPEPTEIKTTKEEKPFELKTKSTEAHISQEPIEAQHQNIINETRKASQTETNNVTIDDYNEPEKAKEFIDAPLKSVKGTFNSIKSTFLSHDKDKEEDEINPELRDNLNSYTNDAVLEEILNDNSTEEDYYDDNDEFVAITPLHDPEEIRQYEESLNNNYDTNDVFNNINSDTTELTPEEISYFDNLEEEFNDELNQNEKNKYVASKTDDMKITVGNKPKVKPVSNKKMKPSERFHKEYQGHKVEPKKEKTTNKTPVNKDDGESVVNIQGVNHTLKRGMSIIYQHHGEKYGSSIHSVNGDNINVTYRGKKIWIKADKITKVF